ncbi:RICIN domain-containing protein [Streptomyces tricolor]|uniref:RICIN domain-containing protein n=1 Tax=Streptomyces tricolor TaxID=68277 RepID=UPI0036EEC721
MKFTQKIGAVASATSVCVALGVIGSAPPAQASQLTFRLKNSVSGKCLQWNGIDGQNITQAKCKNAKNQYWGRAGQKLITISGGLIGEGCVTSPSGHEVHPTGQPCSEYDLRHNGWSILSTNRGAKTPVGNAVCGMLKTTKKGSVLCGAKVSGNRDVWIIN